MTVAQQPVQRRAASLGYDAPLLVVVVALLAFGLMMVFSTTWDISYFRYGSATRMFLNQLVSLGVGALALGLFAWLPRKWWRFAAMGLLGVTLAALLYVLLKGGLQFGAVRGLQPGRFMPSELARLSLIFYLAVWLTSRGDQLHEWGYGLAPFGVIVGLVAGLILLQPDISAAFTVILISVVMFFLAGADLKQLVVSSAAIASAGYLVVLVYENARERLEIYLSGISDLTQASWHVQQAMVAFVDGGIFGRGLGESRQKFGALPAPHTDSIFAVVGEELGLLGCLLLFGLLALLVWRGLTISARARDSLGSLLASGLVVWIALEGLINISVIVGLIPFAGNALPFVSYGGSSLVVTMSAVGLLLNVSKGGPVEAAPRKVRANLDFSRRDGRRRVSGPGRREPAG